MAEKKSGAKQRKGGAKRVSGGAEKGSGSAKKPGAGTKGGGVATKASRGTAKPDSVAGKVGGAVIEAGRVVAKGARAVAKGARAIVEGHGDGAKAGGLTLVMPSVGAVSVPAFDQVELSAPSRTWKANFEPDALDPAEERLRLAWFFREDLNPLLPDGEDFHPRAWTALGLLRAATPAQGEDPQRAARIATLVSTITPIRRIVTQTTNPDDPARAAVRTSDELKLTGVSIELAGEIIANAKKLTGRFPALRGGVIPAAEAALNEARDADERWKTRKAQRAAAGAANSPTRQLASDTLRDCLDHLEAAAIGAFLGTRASMAEPFTGPLAGSAGGRKKKKAGDEKPAPAPAK